jgi:uncharacterized protein (TIGR04255 family)
MAEGCCEGTKARKEHADMAKLPKKLKKDAIVEALWEVRFESIMSTEVPELVIGRLAAHPSWNAFNKVRLPLSDVPATIRRHDPALLIQATLELRQPEGTRVVKIGSNVFSYHVLSPYCGGEQFMKEINEAIDFVFIALDGFRATRFGLRYINVMNQKDHNIRVITDLDIKINVADEMLSSPLNLNFGRVRGPQHLSMVRVASPEFVNVATNVATDVLTSMAALVDVDVFTPMDFESQDVITAKDWVRSAHKYEKDDFWRLVPQHIQEHLVEEWAE